MLAAARTEAEQFLVQAQQEAARLKEQAYEEGYAAGLAAGKEAMAAELASLVAALRQAVAEVIALRPDRLRQAEEDILTLASAMAHAILQREACQSRDVLATMLTQALERLGASGQVVVWVHPLDLALARDLQAAWHDPEVQLVIRSDERVGRGGCRVTSTLGEVDARLEAQLHEIERHLRQHLFTESEEASP
ncbi:MAG: hypothetical protein KatS3mg131_1261 [Candidatus Tectimicrobiota bacterium]|nr:MAG: hypothetical protein KatS3mg131_1261 [Candidatus Tectomicrobia bacterium]